MENRDKVNEIISKLRNKKVSLISAKAVVTEGEIRYLCLASKQIFLAQPVLLDLNPPVIMMGDVHGHFGDLLKLFSFGGFPPISNYLFLGDYADRDACSVETLCLLLAYKIRYPENFFLLRGHLECAKTSSETGFYDECRRKYDGDIWRLFVNVFDCLPVAAIVGGRIFCCHGGLSPELSDLSQIRRVARPENIPDSGLVRDLICSCPDPDVEGWVSDEDGVSYSFGEDVVSEFLEKNHLELLCRSHEVVNGYEFLWDRSLVTFFSAPKYCDYNNFAAMLVVDRSLTCAFRIYRPREDPYQPSN